MSLFEHYQELQPFINRANITLSSIHYCNMQSTKNSIRILIRRINCLLLDLAENVLTKTDYNNLKSINLLRLKLDDFDDGNINEFRLNGTKLMQYLVEYNKYLSQRIDELAPWRLRKR